MPLEIVGTEENQDQLRQLRNMKTYIIINNDDRADNSASANLRYSCFKGVSLPFGRHS